jgi:hypothetical protein
MSVSREVLRIGLLAAAAGLVVTAAGLLREKKQLVDVTTQQIEDTISALDPAARAAVIARLTAAAGEQVKERLQG